MKVHFLIGLLFLSGGASAADELLPDVQECFNAVACYSRPVGEVTSYRDETLRVQCTPNGAELTFVPHQEPNEFVRGVIRQILEGETKLWESLNDRALSKAKGETERATLNLGQPGPKKPIVTAQQLDLFLQHFPACSKAVKKATDKFLGTYKSLAKQMGGNEAKPVAKKLPRSKPLWESCLEGIACNALKGASIPDVTCDPDGNVSVLVPELHSLRRDLLLEPAEAEVQTKELPGPKPRPFTRSNRHARESIAMDAITSSLQGYAVAWGGLAASVEQGNLSDDIKQFFVKFMRCEQLGASEIDKRKPASKLAQAVADFKRLFPAIANAIAQFKEQFHARLGAASEVIPASDIIPNHDPRTLDVTRPETEARETLPAAGSPMIK